MAARKPSGFANDVHAFSSSLIATIENKTMRGNERGGSEQRRQADEAELAALVKRSEAAMERSRRAAAELEASVRALRPAVAAAAEAQPQVPR